MQPWLRKLASFWLHKVNPQIVSLIATIGTLGLLLCLAIIYVLAQLSEEVLEREAFGFDKTILLWIHQFANPTFDTIMLNVTRLGNPSTVVFITLITLGILWGRRYRQEAKIFLFNCLGGAILSYGLKLAFSKPRPQLWKSLIAEKSYSYPSGHALGSIVLYGFLACLLGNHYPKYTKVSYSIAAILIASIGLSRLYLGVHWPTDVIAGYGVGFLWVTFCMTMLKLQKAE
jgi:membrane-associated phospholipid phosphatase